MADYGYRPANKFIDAIYRKLKEVVDIKFPAYGSVYFADISLDSAAIGTRTATLTNLLYIYHNRTVLVVKLLRFR